MALSSGAHVRVGAYICPRGVFVVECRRTRAGLEVQRTFDSPAHLESASDAADHLTRVLVGAHIEHADVAIALRGFGVLHHILPLPAASREVLAPIVERELRRLEPQLVDAVTTWTPLGATPHADGDAQPAQLAAAVPAETIRAFEHRIASEGHVLSHVTAVPAAMLRVSEHWDSSDDVSAVVAALPDGLFLAFLLGGALRLVVEPPFHPDAHYDATALAEEAELGAMFVRQQFRGAQLNRVTVVGAVDAIDDAEAALSDRLDVPVQRLALRDLSAADHVAVGAVLDAESSAPLSFAGVTRGGPARQRVRALHTASVAAAGVALLLAAWTVVGALEARRASDNLALAQHRIQQDSFGLANARATAEQRKLVRNAQAALRFVSADRAELQQTIVSVANAISPGIQVDSIALSREPEGWAVTIGGIASAETSARAVQALHDFYQELPRRVPATDLSLGRLTYLDSASAGNLAVRFDVSFATRAGAPGRN